MVEQQKEPLIIELAWVYLNPKNPSVIKEQKERDERRAREKN